MLRKWLDLYHSATWGQLVDAMETVHSLTNIVSMITEGLLLLEMFVCVHLCCVVSVFLCVCTCVHAYFLQPHQSITISCI